MKQGVQPGATDIVMGIDVVGRIKKGRRIETGLGALIKVVPERINEFLKPRDLGRAIPASNEEV
jgi:hypothetical protein